MIQSTQPAPGPAETLTFESGFDRAAGGLKDV